MALKIMFVDDEPEILNLFKAMAEPLGTEVLTFADSREAAQQIGKEKFDGVFLDAMMPQLDGFELAKLVRASPSNFGTPIVMLTGYNDVETMRKGFQAGVTFFLGKPVSLSRVALIVRTMHAAMLREKRRYARLPFRTMVTCKSGSQLFRSWSINLSEGGMMLEKSPQLAVGKEIDLEFAMPSALEPLRPRAKVVRQVPPDLTAVQFIALKTNELEAIQEYITGQITE